MRHIMKSFLPFFLIILSIKVNSQNNKLIISTNGIDSIKIGMQKFEVEKVIGNKLKVSGIPDLLNQDTAMKPTRNEEYFTCKYKGANLVLIFFRFTLHKKSDFELVGIIPTPNSLIETEKGIKIGVSEKDFIAICKKYDYPYSQMSGDENSMNYVFSDNKTKDSSKIFLVSISKGKIISLSIMNMIGD